MSPRTAYGLLAPEYDSQPNALISLEERTVRQMLPDLAGKLVVDAAAGTGRWTRYCSARGARVLALDFSPEMLAQAPRTSVLAELRHLPLADNSADLTICAFAIGYAPESIHELRRITRPGGSILITDMHPERQWMRSFRTSTGSIQVEDHRYAIRDLSVPGLCLTHLEEPRFGDSERSIFEQCGHGGRFEEAARHPAIFAGLWVKES